MLIATILFKTLQGMHVSEQDNVLFYHFGKGLEFYLPTHRTSICNKPHRPRFSLWTARANPLRTELPRQWVYALAAVDLQEMLL
jgi:hypothetical protein